MPATTASIRDLLPLTALFRAGMSRQIGVRCAQIMGVLALLAVAPAMWLLADGYGPENTTVSFVSRSALAVVISCGALSGVSLARSATNGARDAGIAALASSRGFSAAEIDRSQTLASLRITAETMFGPIAVIGLLAFAIGSVRHLPGAGRAALGAAAFGAVAAAGTGLLATACRRWGGTKGRTWFVLVIAVPWLLWELLPAMSGSEYLSIPGLVGRAWSVLVMGDL
jgi:hypothetical protein